MARSKYTKEEKLKILEELRETGKLNALVRKYEINKSTLQSWRHRLGIEGPESLEQSHSP